MVFLTLVSFVSTTSAQNVVKVEEGNPVPFTSWCLSESAMAKIIADKEQEDQRCGLKLGLLEEKLQAKYDLDTGILNARIKTLEEELLFTNDIKNKEIEKLEKIALDKPNEYWYLFTAGGFVVGVGVTVGIVYLLRL